MEDTVNTMYTGAPHTPLTADGIYYISAADLFQTDSVVRLPSQNRHQVTQFT